MEKKSPAVGVQLVGISDPIKEDVKIPANHIYILECIADPTPGNAQGLNAPVPVFAMVSLSEEDLGTIKQTMADGERFNLYSVERLYLKPDNPLSEKEINDVIVARGLLKFNP